MASRGRVIRVTVASGVFPGLTAEAGAQAIAQGWESVRPGDLIRLLAQADGGRGTLSVVEHAVPGARVHEVAGIHHPSGARRTGVWLELPDGTAVIELADIGGVARTKRIDPIAATSRGLGELVAAALDVGVARLVVAAGDPASMDAGLPALDAIGTRRPPGRGAVVLVDSPIPLLGDRGAVATLGTTIGADPRQRAVLETRLANAADLLGADPHVPGAGAGGGVAFGLHYWGAAIEEGARFVADLTGLTHAVAASDVVLTGAGVGSEVPALVLQECARAGVAARWLTGRSGHGSAGATTLASLLATHPLAGPVGLLRAAGTVAAMSFAGGEG